jgi:hypothetical protein
LVLAVAGSQGVIFTIGRAARVAAVEEAAGVAAVVVVVVALIANDTGLKRGSEALWV